MLAPWVCAATVFSTAGGRSERLIFFSPSSAAAKGTAHRVAAITANEKVCGTLMTSPVKQGTVAGCNGIRVQREPEKSLKWGHVARMPSHPDSHEPPSRIIQAVFMPVSLDQIVSSTRGKVAAMKRVADVRELERRAGKGGWRGVLRGLEGKRKELS